MAEVSMSKTNFAMARSIHGLTRRLVERPTLPLPPRKPATVRVTRTAGKFDRFGEVQADLRLRMGIGTEGDGDALPRRQLEHGQAGVNFSAFFSQGDRKST